MTDPAAMQKQIDDLEFENAELRKALSDRRPKFPASFHLTPSEAKVLNVLMSHERASREMLELALRDAGGLMERDPKIVDVFICKIRRKLGPLGATINTIRSFGYSLDKEAREQVMAGGQK